MQTISLIQFSYTPKRYIQRSLDLLPDLPFDLQDDFW